MLYSKKRLLFMVYLSRFLPQFLYINFIRADRVITAFSRWIVYVVIPSREKSKD